MAHIDQNRSYQDRLRDFGGGLGRFLDTVWNDRVNIDIGSYNRGRNQIYKLYIGNPRIEDVNLAELKAFIRQLCQIGAGYKITVQKMKPHLLVHYHDADIDMQCHKLWKAFFHVCYSPGEHEGVARAYVHAVNWRAGLNIMDFIIQQFGRNPDLYEVKTAGPGHTRLDTIVAYFYYRDSRDALVRMLIDEERRFPGWFAEGLPSLVRREGKGIGSADEQPNIPFYDADEMESSFGSFYSAIIWHALRNTPNLLAQGEDPRHFLDNMLYSLRLLQIDPQNPSVFPAKDDLEAWYNTHFPPEEE